MAVWLARQGPSPSCNRTALHGFRKGAALRCTALHLCCSVSQCVALVCIALHCIALRHVALHRVALPCIVLPLRGM
eukprot:6184833-Pyramimonas_sp.AAC.1